MADTRETVSVSASPTLPSLLVAHRKRHCVSLTHCSLNVFLVRLDNFERNLGQLDEDVVDVLLEIGGWLKAADFALEQL